MSDTEQDDDVDDGVPCCRKCGDEFTVVRGEPDEALFCDPCAQEIASAAHRQTAREVGPIPGYLRTLEDVRDWLKQMSVSMKLDVYDRVSAEKCQDVIAQEIERQRP